MMETAGVRRGRKNWDSVAKQFCNTLYFLSAKQNTLNGVVNIIHSRKRHQKYFSLSVLSWLLVIWEQCSDSSCWSSTVHTIPSDPTNTLHVRCDVTQLTGVTISSEGRVLWVLWRLWHYHSLHFLICYNHQKSLLLIILDLKLSSWASLCVVCRITWHQLLQTLSCKRRSLRILTLHWHCSFASKYFPACSRSLWCWWWNLPWGLRNLSSKRLWNQDKKNLNGFQFKIMKLSKI